MLAILGALAPVFLLIILGYGLRRGGFPGDGFWPPLERLIFFVLFPALLIDSLATAELGALDVGPLAAALIVAGLAVSVLTIALRPVLKVDGPAFASIFMGATRFNTYVGIAAAGALYGAAGLTVAALAIAVLVPLVNVLSVLVLVAVAPQIDGGRRWSRALWETVRNPLILGSAAGIALNVLGLGLPPGIDDVVHALGAAALPMGLLAVGAGLDLGSIRGAAGALTWATVLKLGVMPAAMIAACAAFGVDGLAAKIAILFAALPGASTAYIIARQMGGDAPLMANIITVTTVAAAATMPGFLIVFG